MIRRPPRSTLSSSSAASDVYKRQVSTQSTGHSSWRMGWLEAMNPRLPRQAPPTTSAKPDLKLAYWYLAPQQVEAEWWLCILLSGVYGWMADWGVYAQGADTVRTERPWVDGLLLLALTGSYGLMIWHKLVRGGARYLLQPCHMVTLLAILSLVPWPGSQLCFSLTACLAYNPLLALLFPETGSYRSLLEVWNYWVEHLLILSMPFIRVLAGNHPGVRHTMSQLRLAGMVAMVWHFTLLTVVSIKTGSNINMVLVPHRTMLVLGRGYRVFMWWLCSWCIAPVLLLALNSI
eukprot:TRINITY_DN3176_c0_g1_i10.p1 TRINITY_DN3176_c0_g1~~TRINITY_DN3176_c0_g1_i10.p1  ORF type:complete len:290 (+),score=40.71 TRINITY_DN3176_c0_g1_i10:109-978(+)